MNATGVAENWDHRILFADPVATTATVINTKGSGDEDECKKRDDAQYWREQYEWSQEQLSVANEVAERLGRELRDAMAAVKVLARLLWSRD